MPREYAIIIKNKSLVQLNIRENGIRRERGASSVKLHDENSNTEH